MASDNLPNSNSSKHSGNQKALETGKRGMELVIDELTRRGTLIKREGGHANRFTVVTPGKTRELTVRTKTKGRNSRVWQISTKEGLEPGQSGDSDEFWVLVDLQSENQAKFYILAGILFRRNIYETHRKYLEEHGGERPVTPGSTHHSVTMNRVAPYENRWDLLGLS